MIPQGPAFVEGSSWGAVKPAKRKRDDRGEEKEGKRLKGEEKDEIGGNLEEMEGRLDWLDDKAWELSAGIRILKGKMREWRGKI